MGRLRWQRWTNGDVSVAGIGQWAMGKLGATGADAMEEMVEQGHWIEDEPIGRPRLQGWTNGDAPAAGTGQCSTG